MKKTALYPTISNPPTFGMVLGLKYIEDKYDKIFVCVNNKPLIIPINKVIYMLEKVLAKDNSKYSVITSDTDFENVTVLPQELPSFDDIITESTEIYSNFKSKGYGNVVLIPRPLGWHDTFHRIAYERSVILDEINASIKTCYEPEKYIKENME